MTNERKLLNEIAKDHPACLEIVRAALNVSSLLNDPWNFCDSRYDFFEGEMAAYLHSLKAMTSRSFSEIENLIAYCIRYERRLKKVLYADKEES